MLQIRLWLLEHELRRELTGFESEQRIRQACVRRDHVAGLRGVVMGVLGWDILPRPGADERRPPLVAGDIGRARTCIPHAVRADARRHASTRSAAAWERLQVLVWLRHEHVMGYVDAKGFFCPALRSTGGFAQSSKVIHLHFRSLEQIPDANRAWPGILSRLSGRVVSPQIWAPTYLHFFKSMDAL